MDETALKRGVYIISQAAVLAGRIAGMVAENSMRAHRGEAPAYVEKDFEKVINDSDCEQNSVIEYLYHY
jgi:hypothetical protein